jgi:hypothetical protein
LSHEGPYEERKSPSEGISDAREQLTAAEQKRRAARRRFLLGGAAAVPVLFTVRKAQAITWTECAEQLGGGSDVTGLVPGLKKNQGSFADDFPPCQEMEDMLDAMDSTSSEN